MKIDYWGHLICANVWLAASISNTGLIAAVMLILGGVWLLCAICISRRDCSDIHEVRR